MAATRGQGFDGTEWTRPFTLEFIDTYRKLPCLWKSKSLCYRDRSAKEAAYLRLLEKARECNPDATMQLVKAKINNLRTQYRRELRRMQSAKNSKTTGENYEYEPRLWCFYPLCFLEQNEGQRGAPYSREDLNEGDQSDEVSVTELSDVRVNGDANSNFTDINNSHSDLGLGLALDEDDNHVIIPSEEMPESPIHEDELARRVNSNRTPQHFPSQKRKRKADAVYDVLKLAVEELHALTSSLEDEDELESYGRVVVSELRKMEPIQQCVAKKVINEAIFKGAMGLLGPNSCVTSHHSGRSNASECGSVSPDDPKHKEEIAEENY